MKTKTMKRLAAAVAAITMMSVPVGMINMPKVYAQGSITISTSNHSYKYYMIFKGDYFVDDNGTSDDSSDDKKTLLNIEWADGITDTAKANILNALVTANSTDGPLKNKFTGINILSTATQVAEKIKLFNDDSEEAFAFANIIKDNIGISGTILNDGSNQVDEGYYLIVDETNSNAVTKSAKLLQVLGTETVTPKLALPELHKKIGTAWDNTAVSANTEQIGQNVDYILHSNVPDTRGYNKYFYIIEDEMSDGLDLVYDESTHTGFTITIGNVAINYSDNFSDRGYYVEKVGRKFRIVFTDFTSYAKDAEIIVKYQAKLNDNASLSTLANSSNKNTAKLIYSNDPNVEYTGKPDDNSTNDVNESRPYEPDSTDSSGTPDDPFDDAPSEPVANTPPETVYTYTAQLKIKKIDGASAQNTYLKGAGFTIFDSTGQGTPVFTEKMTTDDNQGVLTFKGLKDGKYIIKETTTPTGYSTAPDYTLELIATPTTSNCTWALTNGSNRISDSIFTIDSDADTDTVGFNADIVNNKGATLPSTGGIGTTIFYVSGGALVLGAAVVLITKKRMSLKDDK